MNGMGKEMSMMYKAEEQKDITHLLLMLIHSDCMETAFPSHG